MDDPKENWYRDAGGPLMTPSPTATAKPSSTKAANAHASTSALDTPNSGFNIKFSNPRMLLHTTCLATCITTIGILLAI